MFELRHVLEEDKLRAFVGRNMTAQHVLTEYECILPRNKGIRDGIVHAIPSMFNIEKCSVSLKVIEAKMFAV